MGEDVPESQGWMAPWGGHVMSPGEMLPIQMKECKGCTSEDSRIYIKYSLRPRFAP